ncbi:MAG: 4a-hydroxytetrahydrobiopterin dehydratase, partial [Trebonia sp.]
AIRLATVEADPAHRRRDMSSELLSQDQVDAALTSLHPEWVGSTEKLIRSIEFADFPTAVEFVNRIAPRCEALDHHPDLALRWRWVDISLATHSAGGVTEKDLTLAGIVDEVAGTLPLAG